MASVVSPDGTVVAEVRGAKIRLVDPTVKRLVTYLMQVEGGVPLGVDAKERGRSVQDVLRFLESSGYEVR